MDPNMRDLLMWIAMMISALAVLRQWTPAAQLCALCSALKVRSWSDKRNGEPGVITELWHSQSFWASGPHAAGSKYS